MPTLEELTQYSMSFEAKCIYAVHQWVSKFGWSDRATAEMTELIEYIESRRREEAEIRFNPGPGRDDPGTNIPQDAAEFIRELPPLDIVVGLCPKCGGRLYGEPMRGCKKGEGDRVFYKECAECPYYSEVIKRRNNYLEIEGGE